VTTVPLPILVRLGTSTTPLPQGPQEDIVGPTWPGQGGIHSRSLAPQVPTPSENEKKAEARYGSWRFQEYGYDLGMMIVWRREWRQRTQSRDFCFLSWWFGFVMVSWKKLGGLGEGKEDAMCDGGRHEVLVRWRLDLLGAFFVLRWRWRW
jgi:hypothetical protein